MPPRKRAAAAPPPKSVPKPKRSKLAVQNDLSAEQEAEIKEAWDLYKVNGDEIEVDGFEKEKDGVIETRNVDVVMRALGVPPRNKAELSEFREILDPDEDGYVTYTHFVELCAIQLHERSKRQEGDEEEDDDEAEEEAKMEEVAAAFKLFTKGLVNRPITMYDLRVVANTLKENVSDEVLQAMILEANGGKGVSAGVNVEAFRDVMGRAGVFR